MAVLFYNYKGKRDEYVIKVQYPDNFPFSPPAGFIVKPKILKTEHDYGIGRACLHGREDVGPRTSGKVVLDWTDACV